MAGKRQGISGLAVSIVATGGYLVYSGIRNVPILEGLRELAQGRLPAPRPAAPLGVSFTAAKIGKAVDPPGGPAGEAPGSQASSAILVAARRHLGVPYRFGGHTPDGWDCSGFVTWVLHQDMHIDLSRWSLCNNTHTVTGQFLITNGLTTVPRDQAQAGDLVCYPGHIGIAVNSSRMVNAPHTGALTREDSIWGQPLFRRVK
jgi:cell wall-associated NlpC family hydrolase